MKQFSAWPPPEWTEVVIRWDDVLGRGLVQEIYAWCNRHDSEGRYHVHGWRCSEGFAFRFENTEDATLFALTWA